MNAKEIVRDLKKTKIFRKRIAELRKRIDALDYQRDMLEEKFDVLDEVSYVVNGCPINESTHSFSLGKGCLIQSCADDIDRSADVQPYIQNNKKKKWFELTLHEPNRTMFTNCPSFKKAKEFAIQWVSKGTLPKEFQERMKIR